MFNKRRTIISFSNSKALAQIKATHNTKQVAKARENNINKVNNNENQIKDNDNIDNFENDIKIINLNSIETITKKINIDQRETTQLNNSVDPITRILAHTVTRSSAYCEKINNKDKSAKI